MPLVKCQTILSHEFFVDLESIVEYHVELSKSTASKYYHGIIGSIKKLKRFPKAGRIVPEFTESFHDKYREIIFEHYRIIYRIEKDTVFVLRVIDSRRLFDISLISSK